MSFEVKVPARINVLGNPSDANEGAHQTISAAVNLFGSVTVSEAEKLTLAYAEAGSERPSCPEPLVLEAQEKFAYGSCFDLQIAALNILLQNSEEFRQKFGPPFPRLSYWTEIPRQSGLGGSTVLVLLTLVALVHFYKLDRRAHNFYVLGEMAQRAEEMELGITCGFADRYVPLLGDIAYLDYRGKLFHKPVKAEPYVTYEKLGSYVDYFPLVIVFPGEPHESGEVHGRMRGMYLDEYKEFKGDYDSAPFLVRQMHLIGEKAWKGKIALLESDWKRFGELMNENHSLVDEMMTYCGFEAGAGRANNLVIEKARSLGALGAKLTGAGAGGSVFVLCDPEQVQDMAQGLKDLLQDQGYKQGRVYIPSIVHQGTAVLA
jgi:glucuronokinase